MAVGSLPRLLMFGRTAGGVNVPVQVNASGSLVVSTPTVATTVTAAQNTGAGLTTLYTFNLPAGMLKNNGDALYVDVCCVMANNANNKLQALIFGGTVITSRSGVADAALSFHHRAILTRTGAATQVCEGIIYGSGITTALFSTPTETLANSIAVAFKAQGTADGDILGKYMIVRYVPVGTLF